MFGCVCVCDWVRVCLGVRVCVCVYTQVFEDNRLSDKRSLCGLDKIACCSHWGPWPSTLDYGRHEKHQQGSEMFQQGLVELKNTPFLLRDHCSVHNKNGTISF